MSPRTGRPVVGKPKNIQVKLLADEDTVADLEFCAQRLGKTKSDVIRLGIQKVKEELDKK